MRKKIVKGIENGIIGYETDKESLNIVNVNIKMIKKWKIKMYIFQVLFLSLHFYKGSFFFQTI